MTAGAVVVVAISAARTSSLRMPILAMSTRCCSGGCVMIDRVPNKPKTPVSAFRIPLELKAAVQAKAKERGDDLTSIVIKAFERYLRAK